MKVFKKVLHYLANICYVFVGIYICISLPGVFGYNPLIVKTGSMSPTYEVGSILYYHNVPSSDIKENDVITYKSGKDSNVTHRVFAIVSEGIVTKGDANISPDANLVKYENVRGKVSEFNIPYIGYCLDYVETHKFIIYLIMLILVLELLVNNLELIKVRVKMKGVELV